MFSSSHEQMHMFGIPRPTTVDRQYKPNVDIAPNCPRCDSPNTKFCYYNNYSLTQPRYFCKGCRRYWTKGGSLRNVPVGGGCSKNRRSRSSVRLSRRAADTCKPNSSGALRPDLALDGMVGGSHHQSPADPTGGERIDLGMLYLKFLNPCPVPELAEPPVGPTSSDMDAAMAVGEMSYALDGRGFDSEVFPGTAGMEWQAAEMQQELCPFPEVHMVGCDWSSLDHSSFGPF